MTTPTIPGVTAPGLPATGTGLPGIVAPGLPGVSPAPVITTPTPVTPSYTSNLIVQPPFDIRLTTIHNPANTSSSAGELLTGYMTWDIPNGAGTQYGNDLAWVDFLYNPSTVVTTNTIQPSDSAAGNAALDGAFASALNTVAASVPMSSSVTFSLLYDRAFDVWGQYDTEGQPIGKINRNNAASSGVMVDVLAFQQFTGMLARSTAGTGNDTPALSSTPIQTNMFVIPSWICFGGPVGGSGLQYFGFVSEWDVQFTHWSQYMIPIRCVINVSFSLLPTSADELVGGSSSGVNATATTPGNSGGNPWFTLNGVNQSTAQAQSTLPGVINFPGTGGIGGT